MKDTINMEMGIKIDADGNVLVRCPLCEAEFKTAVSNIIQDDTAPGENIICPACNGSLEKVQLPAKDQARAKEILEEEAAKMFEKELLKSLRGAGFK